MSWPWITPLLFLCLHLNITAQVVDSAREKHTPGVLFFHLVEDQKEIWTAPFRQRTWQDRTSYLMIGLSAVSFSLDGNSSRQLRENGGFEGFNDFFASSAADILLPTAPFLLALTGELSGKPIITEYGWKVTEAVFQGFITGWILKTVTQRARPHTGRNYDFWGGGNSFPSSHAVAIWAAAQVTVEYFSEHEWLRWVAYPLAAIVSFSRVTSGHHFVSDAVTGSVLGYAIGRYVIH